MARLTTHQHYSSVAKLATQFGIVSMPKPKQDWRLLQKPFVGEIHALPTIRGIAVATNGIIVAIITPNERLIFGHLTNFVADNNVDESVKFNVRTRIPRKTIRDLEEFI